MKNVCKCDVQKKTNTVFLLVEKLIYFGAELTNPIFLFVNFVFKLTEKLIMLWIGGQFMGFVFQLSC